MQASQRRQQTMEMIERVVENELRDLLAEGDEEIHRARVRELLIPAIRRAYDRAGLMLAPPTVERAEEHWAAVLARIHAQSRSHVPTP